MLLLSMPLLMLFSPDGRLILVRLWQDENAQSPMVFTLLGMLIVLRLTQDENALLPMASTPSEILSEVRPLQK